MYYIIIAALLLLSIPYIIVGLLTYFLWQFSFSAKVNGFLTFSDIIFYIPVHLDLGIMFKIDRMSFGFSYSKRSLRVHAKGFHINLIIRSEFSKWLNKRAELLQILTELQSSLKKKGSLNLQTFSQRLGVASS